MIQALLVAIAVVMLSACGESIVLAPGSPDETANNLGYEGYLDESDLLNPPDNELELLQIGAALAQAENVDLSRGQTAIQSTTGYGGIAGRAVDGNAGGSGYNNGSVTATTTEDTPWWQVDLAQNYQLSSIRIWNRADCCADRLANFYVFVADYDMRDRSLADLQSDATVWSYHHLPALAANGSLSVDAPATGRFVRIQKASRGILSLAEVKVYGLNLAEGKAATQSSVGFQGVAARAVDGNTSGIYSSGSVTSTQDEAQPWWQVDLGQQTSIGRIKLFNRRDCCNSRLAHFYVFVSATDMSQRSLDSLVNDPLVWKSFEVAGVGATYLVAGQSKGRYVRVQRNTNGYLSLAEVVVYGAPVSQSDDFKVNPAIYGEWSEVIDWPHIAVHAGLLPSGKILSYDATPDDFQPILDPVASPNDSTRASLWDYVTGIHQDAANDTGDDMFCSGHTLMSDGNYFVAGGTTGYNASIRSTNIFSYSDETWRSGPSMEYARWYPTVTNLASGELLIAGGRGPYPEIYNPQSGTLRTLKGEGLSATNTSWPFLMQAPNGRVLYAGGARQRSLSFIDTAGNGSLTATSSNVVDRNRGSFVAYDIGKMLVTGGIGGRKSASRITMNTAQVEPAKPMHLPRQDHNTLVLPDGSVIVVGGNQGGGFCNDESASYAPEIWNPTTGNWTLLAAQQHPRQYHSTAILLPDATVWSGGQGYATIVSNQVALCSYQNNAEIYSPPYMFNSDGSLAERPVINAAPEEVKHGQTFELDTPDAASVGSISMIRLSTGTHATNFSQRFIPLAFRIFNSNRLSVDAPLDPNIAPSGYYMLFVVNSQGTPSVSRIIKVGDAQIGGLSYNLDFGTETSPLEPGWMKVTPNTNTSLFNWGLSIPSAVDRGQVNSGNRLDRDLVYNSRETQLNINVGNGVWRVTMSVGDTGSYTHDLMSVIAEGVAINENFTTSGPGVFYIGNNRASADETSFDVQVTDGTLSINMSDLGGENIHWVLNSVKVQLLEDVDITAPLIQPLAVQPRPTGTSVPFSVQASGLGQLQYSWNYGDNTRPTAFAANQSQVVHDFPGPGRYTVTVAVRDASGVDSAQTFTQIVYASPTVGQPVSSAAITEYEDKNQVWNVNPDNNSVTVLAVNTNNVLARIDVGQNPVSLAIAPSGDVWVANKESSTISVINPDSRSVMQTIPLPIGSAPHGIVFNQASAFVALESIGKVVKLNASTGSVVTEIDVENGPRHLTLNSDGSRLYATVFITPPLPLEHTLSPVIEDQDGKHGGEVLVLDAVTLQELSTVVLQYNDQPASDESGPGIPNYLGGLVISPDGTFAWVPSKQDNILNGELRTGNSLRFDHAVRAISSRIDLTTQTETLSDRIDHDNASIASQAVFDKFGTYMFTSLEGNRQVSVSDANANIELFRFDVGRAPQGLAISADNTRLYVHNFMDRSVGIYDIGELTSGRSGTVTEIATVSTVDNELLSPQVLRGKSLFYDAKDDRLAALDYMSCASCHNQGGHDGRVWDFSQAGEGLRNTTTLKGRGGKRHGFLHWSANFDEIQDFEAQIREFAGGAGLMSNEDFRAGTRSQPLGDSKAGISPDLDALATYVNSLTKAPETPYRFAQNTTTQGEALFTEKNCNSCHSGSQFTDSGGGEEVHDIGSIKNTSGLRLASVLNGIDTPGLLGVWDTAPYLHDGSAATIEAAIEAHSSVNATSAELAVLAQYVRGLSGVVHNVHTQGVSTGTPVFATDGSLTIDSRDDRVTVAHSAKIAVGDGDFSVSFWIRLEQDATGQWRTLFHKGATNFERTFGIWLSPNDNRIHYVISTSTKWNSNASSTNPIPLNQWVNIAYVRNGSQLQLYIDGELDGLISISGQVLANTGDMIIGQSPWYNPALATYAGVNIYHHALDRGDIDAIAGNFPDSSTLVPAQANLPPQVTDADNELANGGFESGKASWSDCASEVLTTTSQDTFEGVGALQVQGGGCIYQEFAVSPGRTYQMRCQAKSNGGQYTSLSIQMADAAYAELDAAELPVVSAGFQLYESAIVAPESSVTGSITLYSEAIGLFDSCSVVEL